ncbi:hypothetical protein FRACYDRAFT_233512 [Fragilariopsis cylindrus CCMP1102]|uniref:Uncharacterized protein n=1 Tax=Fragilariopsis cylindrus CCMP1102 TaxID=635003 RepID=A0A1E7FYW4_9STRA|nr:hypothetical protein FRACYDRAFT_233512 [Fragilariopsis cylindrus CCMP1102]|eukprot:OEU23340.1 hypothetical protein FRACYDRAFT_233512 [Fragilariopsis cylindrus CCMP1102]
MHFCGGEVIASAAITTSDYDISSSSSSSIVLVGVSLCGEVAVAVTVATTSDYYDISSSSSSSSSSRIRHDDSSGGTISLVPWNKNKSRIRRSKNNKNRDTLTPNSNPFIIEPLQFLRQDFDYSSGGDKDDSSSSSYGNKASTTGVTVFDLNQDGYQDIFYSAGRHSIDQSYVLMNLGPIYTNNNNNNNGGGEFLKYQFSNPLKLGPRNGYFQIDVMNGTKFEGIIEKNHTGVLLVGGNCVITKKEKKNGNTLCPYDGYNTPSILLDVNVSSSSSTEGGFKLDWEIIWTDLYPRKYIGGDSGDRNGAFVSTVTSSQDPPAIVLQGVDGIKIYEATKKTKTIKKIDHEATAEEIYYYEYGNSPTYHIPTTKIPIAKKKQRNDNNNTKDGVYYKNINRFTGLAHGYVGTEPGFVSGPRTGSRTFPDEGPAPPLVAVIKDSETGQYRHYEFGYYNENNDYNGNSSLALQPTGLALSDINGDGSIDLLQTSFLYENEILSDYPLPQNYYLFPNTTTAAGSSKSIDNRTIIKSNGNSNSNTKFSSQQRQQLWMYDGDGNDNNTGIKKSSSINNNITKTTFDSLLSGGRSIATGNIYNVSPYNDIVLGTSARTITNKSNSNSNCNSNNNTTGTASNGHNKNNSTIIIPATIKLYANRGVDVKSNIFLGFQFVQELVVGGSSNSSGLVTKNNNLDLDCSIRDITLVSSGGNSIERKTAAGTATATATKVKIKQLN